MIAAPYFDVAASRLVCPPDFDGDRKGLGDIVLALMPKEKAPCSTPAPDGPAAKLLEFAREVETERPARKALRFADMVPVALSELKTPEPGGPNELLFHRFLCRKSGAFLVGPSGIGKSSFVAQVALFWAIGKPAFGIVPCRPLKILIVQGENDDGDMAEMRDGVLEGMRRSGAFTPQECDQAAQSVRTLHVCTVTGDNVGEMLREVARGYDLVLLDPLFAYAGCDVKDSTAMSHFLREVLNPVLDELDCAIIIVHHTNKPPQGVEKGRWQAGDFAYLLAGSAECTNWARAIIAIRSIGSDDVFELRAAKRGRRLRWQDGEQNVITAKLIAHSAHGICWRELTEDEASQFKATHSPANDTKTVLSAREIREQAVDIFKERPVWTKTRLEQRLADEFKRPGEWVRRTLFPIIHDEVDVHDARIQKGKGRTELMGHDADALEKEAAEMRAAWEAQRQKKLEV